jgi:hypothetical protein
VKGTRKMGISLGDCGDAEEVVAFSDSDWGADTDDRKSVSGAIFFWWGSPVAWFSRKQALVSTSSTEAEIVAMEETSGMLLFIKRLVQEVRDAVGLSGTVRATLYGDNQPGIDAIANGKGRTKHYAIKVKHLAECVEAGEFKIQKVSTKDNLADQFTKPVRISRFRELIGGFMEYRFKFEDSNQIQI